MKKIFKYIGIVALSTLLMANRCTCRQDENHHSSILFENKSAKTIYVDKSFAYPDTLRDIGVSLADYSHNLNIIQPNANSSNALSMGEYWEYIFRDEMSIHTDTLMVYIFDVDLLKANKKVKEARLQRYDLSLQDLQRLNWKLTYPPDLNMKYIKMWPPFNGQ